MNTSDLLDALRAAQTLDAIDALDALIDDQASSGAVRHALHTAARIERERLERERLERERLERALMRTAMTDLLDALRDAPDIDAIDAIDALIDAQASNDHDRSVRHAAVAIERATRERDLVPIGG